MVVCMQPVSYCAICNDQSNSGVDDDVTVGGRKLTGAKYACVECGGERMFADCACAHRKSRDHELVELQGQGREGRGLKSTMSQRVQLAMTGYCDECGNAVCVQCGSPGGASLLGLDDNITRHCPHSDLNNTARSNLQQDQQVN